MRRAVLWDSSAILALMDANDQDHAAAAEIASRIVEERRPSFVTNYVDAETHALLVAKLGRSVARAWLASAGLPVLWVDPSEVARAKEMVLRYDDKDWSLCDAISFSVMATRGVRVAFSFDHHFFQYGRCEVWGAAG